MPISDLASRGSAELVAMPTSQLPSFSRRIADFLESTNLPTPFLVMDVAAVVSKYLELQRTLPGPSFTTP